jgi:DNA repair exonuclease SbcCD ATPase subunit
MAGFIKKQGLVAGKGCTAEIDGQEVKLDDKEVFWLYEQARLYAPAYGHTPTYSVESFHIFFLKPFNDHNISSLFTESQLSDAIISILNKEKKLYYFKKETDATLSLITQEEYYLCTSKSPESEAKKALEAKEKAVVAAKQTKEDYEEKESKAIKTFQLAEVEETEAKKALESLKQSDELLLEIEEIKARTAELNAEAKLEKLKITERSTEAHVETLKAKELNAKAALASLQTAELQAQTQNIETKTAELKNQTQNIETKTAELKNQTQNIETKTAELKNQTQNIETKTAELKNQIALKKVVTIIVSTAAIYALEKLAETAINRTFGTTINAPISYVIPVAFIISAACVIRKKSKDQDVDQGISVQ